VETSKWNLSIKLKVHIFLFFQVPQGHQHGYRRSVLETIKIYSNTGEGKVGDMKFTRETLALMNQQKSREGEFFLFEYVQTGTGKVCI